MEYGLIISCSCFLFLSLAVWYVELLDRGGAIAVGVFAFVCSQTIEVMSGLLLK